MLKILIPILLFITPAAASNQTLQPISTCLAQLPYGLPTTKGNVAVICRKAYATAPDLDARIPLWVVYRLNPENAIGCEPRTNRFEPDQSLPIDNRATNRDYVKSGFDIGHMANAADMAWNPDVQAESFILSNASPQTPNLNRGAWKLLETYVRAWAYSGKTLSIYIGGIWNDDSLRIGYGVAVPSKFYKIIVDNNTKESIAFIMPNEDNVTANLRRHLTSITEIENQSGLIFPIPGDKTVIGTLWKADIKNLADSKRTACQINSTSE